MEIGECEHKINTIYRRVRKNQLQWKINLKVMLEIMELSTHKE